MSSRSSSLAPRSAPSAASITVSARRPAAGRHPQQYGRARWWILATLALLATGLGASLWHEAQHAELQARYLAPYAAGLDYQLQPGTSERIAFPEHGPFNHRLGYTTLPDFSARLSPRGYRVARQVQFSEPLLEHAARGLSVPYREKSHAGLEISERHGQSVFAFRYPARGYPAFDAVPPLVVDSLLFIENRGLLADDRPFLNPAVDWGRFTHALFAQARSRIGSTQDTPGGSTLATQIEKYRHSPGGITHAPEEKLRQMVSAALRAYRDGADTREARRALVLDYLNTVPLSAAPFHGEVHGLADGLRVWFEADFDAVNAALAAPPGTRDLAEQGRALRQVLALMIAHRRPSYYLGGGRDALGDLTDSHLRLLTTAGVIPTQLRDAALAEPLHFRDHRSTPAHRVIAPDKATTMIRSHLVGMLGISLYQLDRLDLAVEATLDGGLQHAVEDFLNQLSDPAFARSKGLLGDRLLPADRLQRVEYSFTLFQRTSDGNRVRVQTDTTSQPFDINEGSKLELGSTAKLRVLATYLEIVAELHAAHADKPAEALRATEVDRQDVLGRWAIDYLLRAGDDAAARDLPTMLAAALERRYPASTGESFFTGGGLHRFSNFRRQDDGRHPTLREALQESINLPFVRLMRDIVRHTMYQVPGSTARLLEDDSDPRRLEYLARFADREGQVFLLRFWRKYQGQGPEEMQAMLLDGLRPTADRLAAAFRYLYPEADEAAFSAFLRERLDTATPAPARLRALYQRYAPGSFDLPDQGYIARVHPLELWLVGYLSRHPQASFGDVVAASRDERQEVYRWLFRTRAKGAQDQRIRTILEVEAFLDIHRRWARLGYPFPHLVPSLATALGSSGDRPAALAELMGIIMNDGKRLPSLRVDALHFAVGTPWETHFERQPTTGERVMAPEVAAALREALSDVVEGGTARRLAGSFRSADGEVIPLGGKTGTGDNRIVLSRGRGSVALNRTATFVFYLGPDHFGTLTAYVTGRDAASFRFTSALPVQILKAMAPTLVPYLERHQDNEHKQDDQHDHSAVDSDEAPTHATLPGNTKDAIAMSN
ncbi:MAG: transglycosylase domain-containing protein [Rhodocyclaceae bacterium]